MNAPDNEKPLENGLTPKQLKVIPYLVAYPSISEAAEQAGIARATIYEWLKIPAFRDELERQRLISYDEILAEFHSLGGAALCAYREAFGYYQTKWSAARNFFEHLARAKESIINSQRLSEKARSEAEMMKRLEAIEKTLAQMKKTERPAPGVVKLKRRPDSKG